MVTHVDARTGTNELAPRGVVHRTRGHEHGPIRRLISPQDVGELVKPFVFLDRFDAHMEAKPLFGIHPHSGIATLTLLFQGDLRYEDTTGKSGVLPAGGVEWMRAGNGVWHDGMPVRAGRSHGYQLWVALPAVDENGPAESLYVDPTQVPVRGPARVILGAHEGAQSPIATTASMSYLHVQLAAGQRWRYEPPADHDVAWLHVDAGRLRTAGVVLHDELAVFAEQVGGAIEFQASDDGDAAFVLGSAVKHPHDLVLGRSSVHTTEAALQHGTVEIARIGRRLHAEGRLR